ncbi:MAG: helix-turn-helix transcriptional regulator [Bacillota bacterium]|nr:helix-turn-helix transcriptional regulator [Bacillota bacterium]
MININKLKGIIVEKGLNIEKVAHGIGMTPATLYRRFQDPSQFTIREVLVLSDFLELTAQEAIEIFFSRYVA